MGKKKEFGFDECFKILAKLFFGKFSKVTTDYEIVKLPKKADVLVVETGQPIRGYVRIFDYFRRFNIIEFKSVADRFRLRDDFAKILVYMGGVLLNEKDARPENTTFTLVCSTRPAALLKRYQESVQTIKNGVYLIQGLAEIPVYLVLANEVTGELDEELALVKEFATGEERDRYLAAFVHEIMQGNRELAEYLEIALGLYKDELREIIGREKINMNIVEKNIEAWNEELGLKEKYKKEGREEGREEGRTEGIRRNQKRIVFRMRKRGYSIKQISEATGCSQAQIRKFLNEGEE